ncbi:MAG: exodeoxyribonuclease III [Legionellales bacterium RIFCSPHIGHO2_12_FULL_35_11]|nr:MAG: exodeoxyribonuclease III [Legionellales bacterium RIFCSPHIGHO2_12_FULL_35_11]
MKIISFNANGIRSAAQKGFYTWLEKQHADFVCIQETKAQKHQLEGNADFFPLNYHCEYYDAIKKGYSGVAIYAKEKPIKITKGFGFDICDTEGRFIQFDYDKFSVISLYLPSGTTGDARQEIKFEFLDKFASHLIKLRDAGQELIICGDYNIAHKNIDIKNWRTNQNNSGFLKEERAWLDNLFGPMGYTDAFRVINNKEHQYTWWSNRSNAWENNVGWRIDYQVITPSFIDKVHSAEIYREIKFSDHAPLIITYRNAYE